MTTLATVLACLLLPQQAPPRDTRPVPREPRASGVIAGRVVDADTNAPISGAVVNVTRLGSTERPQPVETDGRGAFRVGDLPAGDYRITAGPAMYTATYLSRTFNVDPDAVGAKPSLQLLAREARTDIVVRLERALAIEGRVVDELGLPVTDAAVSVERLDRAGGSGQHLTDDRGLFRVHSLRTGAYRVCAVPGIPADTSLPRADRGNVPAQAYVKTCARGTIALRASASPFVEIGLQRVAAFSISGRVVSESGRKSAQVILHNTDLAASRGYPAVVRNGGFTISGVPPGDYTIQALAFPDRSEPMVPGDPERATMDIRVESADLTGLELTTTRGATVAGRIVSDAPLPAHATLTVRRAPTYRRLASPGFTASPSRMDRTFELRNVFDPVLLDVAGLPRGWVTTAVRYKGKDVTDTLTTLATTSDPGDLEIAIGPHSAELVVRPVDADGRVVEGARVFMSRTTGDRLPVGPIPVAVTAAGGLVRMAPVRPGEYAVLVIRADAPVPRGEPFITMIREMGTRLVLGVGERRVDITVTSIPEVR